MSDNDNPIETKNTPDHGPHGCGSHHRHGKWSRLRRFWPVLIPLGIVGVAALVAGFAALTMWLWNLTLPGLFGWPHLAFWQALALLVLARLLFGGFGGRGGWKRKWGHHHGPCHHGHGGEHGNHDNAFTARSAYVNWWKEKGRSDFEAWMKEQKKA